MPDVVVHPPHAVLGRARAPDEAVEERGEERWGVLREPLHDVRVPLEHGVHAVVVVVAVGPDGEQVHDDGPGGLEAARLDGPDQGRDGLRANLDVEHPEGPLASRRAGDGFPQGLGGVLVDGLHDDGGALGDHPREDPRHQAERPSEGFLRRVVLREGAHDLHAGGDEGPEELRGDAVADVPEAQRGDVLDHLVRVLVHLQGHRHDLVRDVVQPRGGLLEVVLSGRGQGEEGGVDVPADRAPRLLVQA
mmetsp:Transcript_60120/g.175673  ORF Transcript_60120/g.175673 Transcript_60120/m.175673 type:complete len:248 (-) Transcript_60120:1309-2052(-)